MAAALDLYVNQEKSEFTIEIAAWVICKTSTQAAAHPSGKEKKNVNSSEEKENIEMSTDLCQQQEDAKTSHHA